MTGSEVAIPDQLNAMLKKQEAQIARALPRHMDSDKFLRVAMTAISQNGALLKCDQESIIIAIMEASQAGLDIDGVHSAIIPFKGQAKWIPMYRGLITMAKRAGGVRDVSAHVVYENEPFDYQEGDNPKLIHQPLSVTARGEGKLGAYSRIIYKDGTTSMRWMWADDIWAIRDNSPAGKSDKQTPWDTHEDEMLRKTVVRAHMKYQVLSAEINRVVTRDEHFDAGIALGTVDVPSQPVPEPIDAGIVEETTSDVELKDGSEATESVLNSVEGKFVGTVPDGECNAVGEPFALSTQTEDPLFEVKVNIQELGEALSMGMDEIGEEMSLCENDKDKLEKLRKKWQKKVNEQQNKS